MKPKQYRRYGAVIVGLLLMTMIFTGCELKTKRPDSIPHEAVVPSPMDLLLPRELEIHPFTQITAFPDGTTGLHVRIQAKDAFHDANKAFGDFRFELFHYRPNYPGNRGGRIGSWDVSVLGSESNLIHWDRHTRSYEFKLDLGKVHLAKGTRLLLAATFTSPFLDKRIADEREIVVE